MHAEMKCLNLALEQIVTGPIHIVDRDRSGEKLGVQVLGSDIFDIDKLASGPESIREFISSGVLLPMVWIYKGSSIPLQSVVKGMRTGVRLED